MCFILERNLQTYIRRHQCVGLHAYLPYHCRSTCLISCLHLRQRKANTPLFFFFLRARIEVRHHGRDRAPWRSGQIESTVPSIGAKVASCGPSAHTGRERGKEEEERGVVDDADVEIQTTMRSMTKQTKKKKARHRQKTERRENKMKKRRRKKQRENRPSD